MPSSWSRRDEKQYKSIVRSCRRQGKGKRGCESLAAAIVNKQRAKSGRTKRPTKSCPRGFNKINGRCRRRKR